MRLSRCAAALTLALLPLRLFAAACPVDPSDPSQVYPGWPTDRSPIAAPTNQGGIISCGTGASGLPTGWFDNSSWGAAVESAKAALIARYANSPDTASISNSAIGVSGGLTYYQVCVKHDGANRFLSVRVAVDTTACDPPAPEPQCEAGTGKLITAVAPNESDAIASWNGACEDGCRVSARSVNDFWLNSSASPGMKYGVLKLVRDGTACTASEPTATETPIPTDPVPEQELEGENCVTSSAGNEYCDAQDYGENCGYVNGQFTCLGKTDTDECWLNDDGSRFCGTSAPTPPVPDSGTPGQKAPPDDSVTHDGPGGTSNTYNYYNSGTVANSSRDPGTSGANPDNPASYDPRSTPVPTVGVGDGEGQGEGGEGGSFAGPEMEEVCSFQCLTQEFWDGVSDAPLVAAWTGIGASVPAGACPSATLSVFGTSYSFTEVMCDIWDDHVQPLLSLVFLFVWPFIGLRIVMSA